MSEADPPVCSFLQLPRWLSPRPKGSQRAYVSFSSCSLFSMMVWTMVEVTSPLHEPTAIIPHASAVTPTTWRMNARVKCCSERFTIRIIKKKRHAYLHAGFGVSHDGEEQGQDVLPVGAGVGQTESEISHIV